MSAVVIGVGNPYRHDDGVGLVVAERLRRERLPGVTVVDSDGEPTRLLDAWQGTTLAVVVDAVQSGDAAPGTVHRGESFAAAPGRASASSHTLDLSDAWALGAALGRLPARLLVYAIVGARFDVGLGLSAPVAGAVDEVAAAVAAAVS